MSFFQRKKSVKPVKKGSKRRIAGNSSLPDNKSKKRDVEISSDSEEEIDPSKKSKLNELHDEEELDETVQERKVRLAKKYLEEIDRAEKERLDSRPEVRVIDGEVVTEKAAPIQKYNLETISADLESIVHLKNGHRLSVTVVAVSSNDEYVISGGKDGRLIKWCLQTMRKKKVVHESKKGNEDNSEGHSTCILAIAITSDSSRVASSDESNLIKVWDSIDMKLLHTYKGHRAPVTGLSFRINHHTLFSCSRDKTVKLWDIDELGYIETLFGHQDAVTAIDSMYKERAITAGGRDASIRVWKIVDESQLLFQAPGNQSIDCVKYLDEQHFVSGSDDGNVSFWGLFRKKHLFRLDNAHGVNSSHPNWISAIATFRNSNIFATGSQDGRVNVWKVEPDFKKFQLVLSIPVVGFVNSLDFAANGEKLIVGVGQEHRLGRWWRIKEARNQVLVVPLTKKLDLPDK